MTTANQFRVVHALEVQEVGTVTVLEGTDRPGWKVVREEGYVDTFTHQGEYHIEETVEVYEDRAVAEDRVSHFNSTDPNVIEPKAGHAEDSTEGSYLRYSLGDVALILCIVSSGTQEVAAP